MMENLSVTCTDHSLVNAVITVYVVVTHNHHQKLTSGGLPVKAISPEFNFSPVSDFLAL